MRLALDHHCPTAIAVQLRSRGHDVEAAVEREWHALSDAELLEACGSESRALLTNNVTDFALIARLRAAQGQSHSGLVFTSDASLRRTPGTVGRYVQLLDALLQANPGEDAFADRIEWLGGST